MVILGVGFDTRPSKIETIYLWLVVINCLEFHKTLVIVTSHGVTRLRPTGHHYRLKMAGRAEKQPLSGYVGRYNQLLIHSSCSPPSERIMLPCINTIKISSLVSLPPPQPVHTDSFCKLPAPPLPYYFNKILFTSNRRPIHTHLYKPLPLVPKYKA